MGASEGVAENMNTFMQARNEGLVLADVRSTPDSTTPTSIAAFAKVFAHVNQRSRLLIS